MRNILLLLLLPVQAFSQLSGFSLVIVNEHRQPIAGATVRMLSDGKVVNSVAAGEDGSAVFGAVNKGVYKFLISATGY